MRASDGLSKAQYRGVVAAIALVHVAGLWAVLQVPAVRRTVVDAAPMFVDLLAPAARQAPAPPPPSLPSPVVQAPLKTLLPSMIAAPATTAPAPFEAPPATDLPTPSAPVLPVVAEASPAPPAPLPPPKNIPASEVQYLVRPAPEYPRLSVRMGESGLVMLRVFIDEAGLPREVRIEQSSGFARLDDTALAAVRQARFKPPTLNGQPISGWARIPIPFELEKRP